MMKEIIKIISMVACISIGLSCASLKDARLWAGRTPGERALISINGYWYSEKFGPGRFVQTNDDVKGYFPDYFVEGKVHGSTVSMILSDNGEGVSYTARLTATKEGNLSGKYQSGIMQNYSGSDIQIKRETEESFRERLNRYDYFFPINIFKIAFSPTLGMEEGRRWLGLHEGKTAARVDGSYGNPAWGGAVIIQNGSSITGNLGVYELEGVINGRTVYLMIRYWKKLYFTAIVDAGEKGTLIGTYYRGITYSTARKGDPLLLVK